LTVGLRSLQVELESFGFPLRVQFVKVFHLQQFREMQVPALDEGTLTEMFGDESLAN
jgi:hypothetical protein